MSVEAQTIESMLAHCSDGARPDPVPPRVVAAICFIGLCNQHMGLTAFPGLETEIKEVDLHPKQEAVFNLACQFLGDYFAHRVAN